MGDLGPKAVEQHADLTALRSGTAGFCRTASRSAVFSTKRRCRRGHEARHSWRNGALCGYTRSRLRTCTDAPSSAGAADGAGSRTSARNGACCGSSVACFPGCALGASSVAPDGERLRAPDVVEREGSHSPSSTYTAPLFLLLMQRSIISTEQGEPPRPFVAKRGTLQRDAPEAT